MSTWEPMTPHGHRPDDEIAAADPGAGAPPPAEGFGVAGEEPDRPEEPPPPEEPPRPGEPRHPGEPERTPGEVELPDTPFRPPDPGDVGRA
ncbi:hypothetical protein JOD57_004206 [Geodermatophilus bullaregiensis]|uniref:hypothetical protein n=1 Tax=Geodermatophilus bullaregiensis TaxID=1564160 RepID=UPI00195C51E4|nr:hypothetical protein [Geodermatophilus bullaregiensis]MBM7808369.1 hypothetical protein [Geodermatophilus bullaregiensis]